MLAPALVLATLLIHTVHAGPGRTHASFELHEPAGVILLFRVTVPHQANVTVAGTIPHVAGVRLSTTGRKAPSLACRRRGSADVCTQGEEWCPMPEATWRFNVAKLAGPAGPIRVEFVVGQPPR